MSWLLVFIHIVLGSGLGVSQLFAMERHIMESRVSTDEIEAAREMVSPLPDSPELVEKGKAIYEGKGTCLNCHGKSGRGDGPGGLSLNPSPRNFSHHGMWRHRTEGEIFWVIKNGSPGTGMIPFGGLLTDEEIWTVMQYERSFAKGHGSRGMGSHGNRRGRGGEGQRGSKGMGGHYGKHGGHNECCQE